MLIAHLKLLTMYINSINFYKIILNGKGLGINNPIPNSQTVLWVCNKPWGLASTLESNGPRLPRALSKSPAAAYGHCNMLIWQSKVTADSSSPVHGGNSVLTVKKLLLGESGQVCIVSWDNGSGTAQLQVGASYVIPFPTLGQARHRLSFCL